MSEIVPVVTVKRKADGHICDINETDFDEELHVKATQKMIDDASKKPGPDGDEGGPE